MHYPVTRLDAPPAEGWTDEYKTTKLVLKRIEAGTDPCGYYTLTKAFYIGVFEVTQKQWELVMGSNPSSQKGGMRPVGGVSYNAIRGSSLGAKWPTTNAVDETSFLGKLRARTGLTLDLPTEAQWKYACRAGTDSFYNNGGHSEEDLRQLGRYEGNVTDGKGGYEACTTVGSYEPNAWGLYDMHGNVWEWCLDWIREGEGPSFESAEDPVGATSGAGRCQCGGSWDADMYKCAVQPTYSYFEPPATRWPDDGLRLACPDEIPSVEPFAAYCVVDLAAGANANWYEVTMLDAAPEEGWTDEYKTTKLVLKRIEKGADPLGRYTVTKPFYIGVFEVTQKQWELVMGSNPSELRGDVRPVESVSYQDIRGYAGEMDWPTTASVDADSFVGRLRARTGLRVDLPTLGQSEYACRAGTRSNYNNGGNTEADLVQVGRYNGNRTDGKGGYDEHTTVGSYAPNAWGLYDMHGNVWEWCLDWGGADASGKSPLQANKSEGARCLHGGDWAGSWDDCGSSDWTFYDYSMQMGWTNDDSRRYFGFRLASSARDPGVPWLRIMVGGEGTVTGSGAYEPGQSTTLRATAANGYVFAGWYADAAYETPLQGTVDYRTTSFPYEMGAVDTTVYAKFVSSEEDKAEGAISVDFPFGEIPEYGYVPGFPIEPLKVTVVSASLPTVTVTGLPTGMRWDANAMAIVGTPTVPGLYTAVFTVKSGSVAKTAAVDLKVKNFVSSYIGMADTYDGMIPGVAIEPIPFIIAESAPTAVPENAAVSVSGLPAGLKWVAASKTVEGTPTTPGAKTVTFTLTWTDAELGRMTEKATSTFIVEPFPALTVTMEPDAEAAGCKVSGSGAYAANKTVYLSATAAKGYVFAGWYDEGGQPLSGTVDYRTARFPYVTGAQDTTVYAKFVSSEEDKAEGAISVDFPFGEIPEYGYVPGFPIEPLKVTVVSASLPTVTVTGLPSGLKWDSKTLTISGTPNKPGDYTVTVTAKNSSGAVATVQPEIRIQPPFTVREANYLNALEGGVIGYDCAIVAYEAIAGVLDNVDVKVEGLPDGVTADSSVEISEVDYETEVVQVRFEGAPSAQAEAKTYPVTVRVTYEGVEITKQYDFVVRRLPEALRGITLTAGSSTVPVGGGAQWTLLPEKATAEVELAFADTPDAVGSQCSFVVDTSFNPADGNGWDIRSDSDEGASYFVNSLYNPSTRKSGFIFVMHASDSQGGEAWVDAYLWDDGAVEFQFGYYREGWENNLSVWPLSSSTTRLPCVIPDNYPLPDKDSPATVLVSGVPADGLVAGEAYTLPVTVYDAAFPTVTATGLPTGMRWDANAMAIVGTPTVPGLYTAVFTVKSGSVAKTAAADLKVKNFVSSYIGMADTYDGMIPGVAIEPIPFIIAESAPTAVPENAAVSVSGLPAGLKWGAASKTIEGTPTTPGAKTVTFTLTWTDAELGRMTEKATSAFIVEPFPALTVTMEPDAEAAGCKVSGSGAYAANKTVYLSATAVKGYVFAGWYSDATHETPLQGTVDYRTARFPYVTGAQDTTVYGRFVPSEEDRGIEMALADGGPFTPGVALVDPLRLTVTSASLPNVTAKGLPPGLKWDAKSLQITGTPTTPGLYSVTFTATNATVKSPAVTYTADIAIANYVCDAISLTVPDCPILPGIPLSEQRDGAGNELTISVSAPNVMGLRVSGLPTGLSWDARTFRVDSSKAATKPGNYTVDVTGTYIDETGKRVTGRTTAVVTVAPLPVVTVAYNAPMGSVTGAGSYLPRTATVTLSARPATDCVFAGWYRFLEDGESVEEIESAVEIEGRTAVPLKGTVDYRNPSFRFTAPDSSVSLFARFVLKREDTLPGIGLNQTEPIIDLGADTAFGSADMPVFDPAKSYEVSLRIASHSLPKVTVTGLPTGLYLDQNRLVLGGQPTAPGYYDMTIAVTNQSGYQASRRFRVRVLNRNTLFPEDWNPDDILLADVGANTEIALDKRLVGATAAGVPPGMAWDAATATLGGVPTYAGTYTVTFRKDGQTVTVTVTVSADTPYCVPISGEGEMTSWDQSRLVVLSGDVTYQPIFRIRPGSGFASAWPTVTVVGLPSGLKIEYETYETFGDASDCPFAPTFLGREEPGTCRDAFVSGTTRAAPGIYPVLISARNASGGQTECVVEVVVGSPTWPLSARYGTSDPASASQPDKPFAAVLEHTKKQLSVWSEGEAETRNFVASRGLEDDTFGDVDYEGWYSDKAWQDSYLIRLGIPESDSLERCGFDGDTASLAPAVDTSTMLYHPVPGWSRPVAAGSYRVSRLAYDWGAGMTYGDAGLLTVMQDGSVKASFGSGVTGTGWLLLTESASDTASDVARILLVLEDAYGYEEGVVVRPDINPGETVPSDMRWTSVDGPTPTL